MKCILHVTDLDSWLWFKKIDAMPTEEMIGRLLRTEPPNENMLRGTAWHTVLENPNDLIDTIEQDGYKFIIDCEAEIVLPQIREIRTNKTYSIDGIDVTLTGKLDGITIPKITDHKLTFKPNMDTYADSYQWRAYLDIFCADIFEYIIYHGYAKNNIVTIKNISTLKMYRYPKMLEDIKIGISELLNFIKTHVPQMLTKR